MQNIHVKRYEQQAAGYAGWIEPDDGSWVLFVPADGSTPHLYKRNEQQEHDGKTEATYLRA